MRITDLRWHICNAGWRNWVFVELVTDSGTGWGEATAEGRELTVTGHLEDLRRVVVGRECEDINLLRRDLVRDPFWVGGYVAGTGLAAIETALWDVLGTRLGVPVWQLLGGRVRERVPVYANGWYFGAASLEDWVSRAGEVVELGYRALKFDPFGRADRVITREEIDFAVEVVAHLRGSLGPRVELLIEGHGRFDVHSALRVADALKPFGCLFFEEPLPPGNNEALALVAQRSAIPIAAGERCYSRMDAHALLQAGAVSVLQPDVVHAGGISETIAIAAMAEARMVSLAPHNPNGPIATAATLTVDSVIPNLLMQEMLAPWDVPWRHEVVVGCPSVVDGYLRPSEEPGLGVRVDLDAVAEHPYTPIDPNFWSAQSIMETVDLQPPSIEPPGPAPERVGAQR